MQTLFNYFNGLAKYPEKYGFSSSKGHCLLEERATVNILYFNPSNWTFDSVQLKKAYDAVFVIKRWESFPGSCLLGETPPDI